MGWSMLKIVLKGIFIKYIHIKIDLQKCDYILKFWLPIYWEMIIYDN